ncbi:MAG TPA: hypothetical protein VH436_36275 [Vicinamibacterales bacterium]|jgi:hypothetical protein
MPTLHRHPQVPTTPAEEPETALEEMIDVSLHPDRAHHDELGHTRNGSEQPASPREQPPAPLDVEHVDE